MKQIEFQGVVHEFPDEFTYDHISAALDSLIPKKRKTSFKEDVGIGLSNAAGVTMDTLDMLAGGVAGIAGFEEDRDKIFDQMVARQKARQLEEAQLDQGLGGKITSGVAQAVPMMAGGAILGGVKGAMMAPSAINALSGSSTNIQQGATPLQAGVQAVGEGAIDYASMMLPVGQGVVKGALWGAGGNVVGQGAVDALGNITMDGTEAQKNYSMDLTDPNVREKYLVNAGVGAVLGGATGPLSKDRDPGFAKQTEGDVRKLAKDRDAMPSGDEVNKVRIQQVEAELKLKQKKISEIERAEKQVAKEIDIISKTTFKDEGQASVARKIIEDKINKLAELKKEKETYTNEIAPLTEEITLRQSPDTFKVAPPDGQPSRETAAPYSKNPGDPGSAIPGKRFEINEKITEDWAKQQTEDTLQRNLDARLVKLEELQARRDDTSTGKDGPNNQLRDTLLPAEIALLHKELENRGTNQVTKTQESKPLFRSEEEVIAGSRNKKEAFDSSAATRKTADEAQDIQRKRNSLIEKEKKTLEDHLEITRLSDEYDFINMRNNPKDEVQSTRNQWIEELQDLKENFDSDEPYVKQRLPVIEENLRKLDEFERRVALQQSTDNTNQLRLKPDETNMLRTQEAGGNLDVDLRRVALRSAPEDGVRNMLTFISENKEKYGKFSEMANRFLSNPEIKPLLDIVITKYIERPNKAGGIDQIVATFDAKKNAVILPRAGMEALVFLHEVEHSISNMVISRVSKFLDTKEKRFLDGLSKKQIEAGKNIIKIYDQLKGMKRIPFEHIKNAHELVAYLGTDERVARYYRHINEGSYLKKIWNNVKRMFGYKQNEKTITEAVNDVRDTFLAEHKDMTWDQHIAQTKGITEDFLTKVAMAPDSQERPPPEQVNGVWFSGEDRRLEKAKELQGILDSTLMGNDLPHGYELAKNYFGFQQLDQNIIERHPLVDHVFKAVSEALNAKSKLVRNWVAGTAIDDIYRQGKHAITTLQHREDGDAPIHILNTSTPADLAAVRTVLLDNFNNQRNHKKANTDSLTPTQRGLYFSLANLFERMRNDVNAEREAKGMPLIPKRDGWVPSIRIGDYAVFVKDKFGTVVSVEKFRSEYEARQLVKKVPKEFKVEDIIDIRNKLLPDDTVQQLRENFAEEFGVADQLDSKDFGQSMYGTKTSHDMYRSGAAGFLGNRWGRSEAQNVGDFKKAIIKSLDEYANAHKRAIVNFETSYIMDKLRTMDPRDQEKFMNAMNVSDTIIKSATSGHDASATVDRWVRTFIDDSIAKVINSTPFAKEWYPNVPILDRAHGLAAQFFYINALTSRPGFWFAQLMSTPQSFRQLFRETDTVGALSAMGKGMLQAFSGGDREFKDAVLWVANNRDTFHPQFINEINEIPGIAKIQSAKLKTLMEWGTGQKAAAGADALSRYMTFSVMYSMAKKQGLRGKALWNKASELTENTMVMYNSPYKAPLIQNLGLTGQAISPLMTFATAQQGLLLADMRYAKKTGNYKPLVATALTAAAMGGAIGLPFIVEYELLAEAVGLPSIRSVLLNMDKNGEKIMGMKPDTVLLGGVTAGTDAAMKGLGFEEGMDTASGLRWNQILSKQLTGEGNAIDMLPAISYGIRVADALKTIAKHHAGEPVTDNNLRKSYQTLSILVGQKFALDLASDYYNRSTNPQGPASRASKMTTDTDRLSTLVGSQSISARKEAIRQKDIFDMRKDAKATIQNNVPFAVENFGDDPEAAMNAILEAYKKDPSIDINALIKKNITERNVPQYVRDLQSKNPNVIERRGYLGQ